MNEVSSATEQKKRRRAALLGSAFIGVGIPGLVLPFLQGLLLIAIGLVFFSLYSSWLSRWIEALKETHPRAASFLRKAQQRADKLLAVE